MYLRVYRLNRSVREGALLAVALPLLEGIADALSTQRVWAFSHRVATAATVEAHRRWLSRARAAHVVQRAADEARLALLGLFGRLGAVAALVRVGAARVARL